MKKKSGKLDSVPIRPNIFVSDDHSVVSLIGYITAWPFTKFVMVGFQSDATEYQNFERSGCLTVN